MRFSLLSLIVTCVILVSCETDVDISGPWENIPVVYSILDPSDTIHYVRINRVFSGNESAYVMATNPDSLMYNADLSVKIFVKNEKNHLIKTMVFNKLFLTKDSVNAQGQTVFAVDKHHVYASTETLPYKNDKNMIYTYELKVILPDGKVVTSLCHPLVAFQQTNPVSGQQYNLTKNTFFGTRFRLPRYSGGAKLKVYFNYYEWYSADNYNKKTISLPVAMQKMGYEGEESMGVRGADIYNALKEVLTPPTDGMRRYPGKVNFEYVIADENYAEQIWFRSSGISSEVPPITNINGGYGLFACRSYIERKGFKPSEKTISGFYEDAEMRNIYGFDSPKNYTINKIYELD
ncbi:MAG TPA: hypothetical protein PLY32_03595 [Salinivirgaceae bacterium]|nr:hypothetical protein [Salinivirgaceae bacterium]HQA76183.1 hypothetical protein [Salinivirgaceae bacterium]